MALAGQQGPDLDRERLGPFDGGYVREERPENLAPNQLQAVEDMLFLHGALRPDSGYTRYGPKIEGEEPHVVYQSFPSGGGDRLLLLTTSTLYVRAQSVPEQWQFVPYRGPASVLTANAAAGATSFPVSGPAKFTAGLSIEVFLANEEIYATTVDHVAGDIVYISGALPAPGALAGEFVRTVYTALQTNGAVATGATTMVLHSLDGVAVGSRLGLTLSNSQQFQFTVGAVNTGTKTVTIANGGTVPSPGALDGAAVALAIALDGDLTIQPQLVAFPGVDWTIISNGKDPIFYYDGAVCRQLPGLPEDTKCQAMTVAHEQLLIANTIERGVAFPRRLRASDIAKPWGWVPQQNGIAAIYNLVDTPDFILAVLPLGPWVIVYRENSIMRGSYLGVLNNIWKWDYMVTNEGILSQGAVVEVGAVHALVGSQNVYLYDGGYTLTPIGDNIFAPVLSADGGDINISAKSTVFLQYVAERRDILFFHPTGQNALPDGCARYNLLRKAWFFRTFAHAPFVSAGRYKQLRTISWAEDVGTWEEDTSAWNSRVFLANSPTLAFCAPDADKIFFYDYTTPKDGSMPIAWSFTTKDLGVGNQLRDWDTIVLYGRGDGILLEYSLDRGSFIPLTDRNGEALLINFGQTASERRFTLSHPAVYLTLRLSGTDNNALVSWIEVQSSFLGEY